METSFISLNKILFVDEPFAECYTLRCLRSRFIWEILSQNFDADLLLLKTEAYLEKPVPSHTGYDKLYSLSLAEANQLFPDTYHILASGQAKRFAHILDSKRYEMIVFAGLNCLPLLYLAKKALPYCKFVIDIDRNYLPDAEAKWKANKNLDSINHLWAYTRQRLWDKFLFKPSTNVFFASPADALEMQATFKLKPECSLTFPLPMPKPVETAETDTTHNLQEQKYILFWGREGSFANLEAARILVSELYPRISKKLVEKDMAILIFGHEQLKSVCGGRIRYVDPTEDAETDFVKLLANALFVLLPLAVPDSEGRILQCAAAGKALVCTNITISGWNLPDNCVKIQATADALAPLVTRWLSYPREVEASAANMQQYCLDNFGRESLIENIVSTLNTWMGDHDQ